MGSDYKDFGYRAPGPGNGDVDRLLAEHLVDLTRRLDGVKYVCDLGCGNGYLASRLGALGLDVTGIDASETGLEIAKQHYCDRQSKFCARRNWN